MSIPSHIAFELGESVPSSSLIGYVCINVTFQLIFSVAHLDRSRPELLGDEMQRRFALDIQNNISSEVVKQLDDFRCPAVIPAFPPNTTAPRALGFHRPVVNISLFFI